MQETSTNTLSFHVLKVAPEELHPHDALNETLKQFWNLESLCVLTYKKSLQDEYNESIEFTDGCYHVRLPFKPNCNQLEDNYGVSYQSLKSLWKKIRKNPKPLSQHNEIILDQKEHHIIEETNHTTTYATIISHTGLSSIAIKLLPLCEWFLMPAPKIKVHH